MSISESFSSKSGNVYYDEPSALRVISSYGPCYVLRFASVNVHEHLLNLRINNSEYCSDLTRNLAISSVFKLSKLNEENLFPQGIQAIYEKSTIKLNYFRKDNKYEINFTYGGDTITYVTKAEDITTLKGHIALLSRIVSKLNEDNDDSIKEELTKPKGNKRGTVVESRKSKMHKTSSKVRIGIEENFIQQTNKTICDLLAKTEELQETIYFNNICPPRRTVTVINDFVNEGTINSDDKRKSTLKDFAADSDRRDSLNNYLAKLKKDVKENEKATIEDEMLGNDNNACINSPLDNIEEDINEEQFNNEMKEVSCFDSSMINTHKQSQLGGNDELSVDETPHIFNKLFPNDTTISEISTGKSNFFENLREITQLKNEQMKHKDPKKLENMKVVKSYRHFTSITALHDLNESSYVVADLNGIIQIRDKTSHKAIKEFDQHKKWVRALLTINDEYLISAGGDKVVNVWDLKAYKLIRTLKQHTKYIEVLIHIGGNIIASAGQDTKIVVWNITKNKELFILKGHTNIVYGLLVFDKDVLLSVGYDSTIRLWTISQKKSKKVIQENNCLTTVCGIDLELVAVGTSNGLINIWHIRKGTMVHSFNSHCNWIYRILKYGSNILMSSSNA